MTSVNNVSMQPSVAFRGSAKQGKDILGKALDNATERIAKMDSSIPLNQQMDAVWNEAVESLRGKVFPNSVKGAEALERKMINEALMGRVMADLCNPKLKNATKYLKNK